MQKINLFEGLLLVMGVVIAIVGYSWIKGLLGEGVVRWEALQTVFLWFILMALMVLIAILESIRKNSKPKKSK